MQLKKIVTTDSTNNWLAVHEKEVADQALVYCEEQTAGRGQRENSWESEPGKNITASIVFHPKSFPAFRQFVISEAIALSIVDFLGGEGVEAKIKWPNDVYVGDKKICGILVEHVVMGNQITRTIAGFGININQTEFKSDAPNPVSLSLITGKNYNIDTLIEVLVKKIEKKLLSLEKGENQHNSFLERLWRKDDEVYEFYDRIKKEAIKAKISDVGEDGMLTLVTDYGEKRKYAFKEVEFLL